MFAPLADEGRGVEAQLTALAHGAVTGRAARAEDRLDVTGVIDLGSAEAGSEESEKEDRGGRASHEGIAGCRRRSRWVGRRAGRGRREQSPTTQYGASR